MHITVLKKEAISALMIKKTGIYVDATLGGGGHTKEILEHLGNSGRLISFDQDNYAIKRNQNLLEAHPNFTIIESNFKNIKTELENIGIEKIDGILFDLGMSSFQIDQTERGFSYLADTALDMRMDQNLTITAEKVLNEYSLDELTKVFRDYGEEKNAYQIARSVINNRPLKTSHELVAITDRINFKTKGHSAKRVFQALRIEVNQELASLEKALESTLGLLNEGGRLVVISFHSLEDKMVKHFIKKNSEHNLPKNLPITVFPKTPLTRITRKPIYPTSVEMEKNSRSRSAIMRVAEK